MALSTWGRGCGSVGGMEAVIILIEEEEAEEEEEEDPKGSGRSAEEMMLLMLWNMRPVLGLLLVFVFVFVFVWLEVETFKESMEGEVGPKVRNLDMRFEKGSSLYWVGTEMSMLEGEFEGGGGKGGNHW